jgi:hypothetical protein
MTAGYARRGNKKTYSGNVSVFDSKVIEEKDFRDFSDGEFEEAWKRAVRRDPFTVIYAELKKAKTLPPINCCDLRYVLEFLHKATGDAIFQEAASAMKQHGLVKGGLKATALRKIDPHKRATWAVMPKMHGWVVMEKTSPHKAAKLVAAQRGIPGKSFDAVVADLRKTYPKWLELIKQNPEVGKTL